MTNDESTWVKIPAEKSEVYQHQAVMVLQSPELSK